MSATINPPVLITGAGGFIGRRLVAKLLEADVESVALLMEGEAEPEAWAGRVRVVRGDVRDAAAVAAAMQGIATVFHLAALIDPSGDYDTHWAVTAEGSRNVYAAAAAEGARVIVTTSICAYGDKIARGLCREDEGRGAYQGPYGRAKKAQEDLALEAAEKNGLAVTIVRPSNVYGAGSRPWVDMLAAGIQAGLFPVLGDGSGNAGLLHVDNLADALVLIGSGDSGKGRTYNVCDGLEVSWRRYMDDIARIVGAEAPPSVSLEDALRAARANEDPAKMVAPKDPMVVSLEAINLIGSSNLFDTTRIREEYGWEPRVGYDEALAEIEGYLKA